MAEKFKPAEGQPELPPLQVVGERAEVTEEDMKAAADEWKADPPDAEFDEILEAEDDQEREESDDAG